jgi:erythromycin esterase-like protein
MTMMARKNQRRSTKSGAPTPPAVVPADLRSRLETVRLDLLALFRALDQLQICQDLPQELQGLFDLDADCAEALWALDQQAASALDWAAMTRDTLASLAAIPSARQELMDSLTEAQRRRVTERTAALRARLLHEQAYNQIPGRDPQID